MVLQTDREIPVWEHAKSGEKVTVTLKDEKQLKGLAAGNWLDNERLGVDFDVVRGGHTPPGAPTQYGCIQSEMRLANPHIS